MNELGHVIELVKKLSIEDRQKLVAYELSAEVADLIGRSKQEVFATLNATIRTRYHRDIGPDGRPNRPMMAPYGQ